jgi:hypothetical protein
VVSATINLLRIATRIETLQLPPSLKGVASEAIPTRRQGARLVSVTKLTFSREIGHFQPF